MSLPGVTTTISGVDMPEVLDKTCGLLKVSTPVGAGNAGAPREREARSRGWPFRVYKPSIKFDNPEARLAHEFPLDMQQVEVKEMMKATENDGHPFINLQ